MLIARTSRTCGLRRTRNSWRRPPEPAGCEGDEEEDCSGRKKTDGDDGPEGGSPAEGLAQGGASRDAEGRWPVSGRRTSERWLERAGCGEQYLQRRRCRCRRKRRGKERSKPGGEEEVVGGGDGAGKIAESEDAHEKEEASFRSSLAVAMATIGARW